jgi:hypothetical protein
MRLAAMRPSEDRDGIPLREARKATVAEPRASGPCARVGYGGPFHELPSYLLIVNRERM